MIEFLPCPLSSDVVTRNHTVVFSYKADKLADRGRQKRVEMAARSQMAHMPKNTLIAKSMLKRLSIARCVLVIFMLRSIRAEKEYVTFFRKFKS